VHRGNTAIAITSHRRRTDPSTPPRAGPALPPRITAANVNRGCGCGCSIAMPSLQPVALLVLVLLTTIRGGLAAPDITMSIHGDLAGSGTPSSFTVNQVGTDERIIIFFFFCGGGECPLCLEIHWL